ncbi:Putative phage tail protein [Roseovarius nanhaiticus]|uniref:Putative phage tail protein n=1 Tax=Roseovarius nanhaiticus TaxID=573024 RepID=A0A1N7EKA3_9RHOB|nr:glycoside hydrolase TIM-barrel-like domain-containing protein [Roseovarius nanhaiticus]SEK72916.1 Putative phage tail protein [Roseovarius nanhaiticus]SIR88507.1 Putative phage tail protein [Roseovarius nanhaiticus]
MATILLSAAGAALGGSMGGTVLGLSMAAAGRFAGGIIGRSIDQRLLGQGSDVVETGRTSRLRLTGSGEGDAIAQVYGRMRVAGQVIWATEFREEVNVTGGGGKGAPSAPKTRQFSYSVSLALALCEGEISHVGRIWADGGEIARDSLAMRVYTGSQDQLPDPRIEAVEGAGTVPAYRGTAYVVIEDLELGQFGNRVPQFTFEVTRPSQSNEESADLDPARAVRAVAMLPGSGEYALATSPVTMNFGAGASALANVNTPSGKADFSTSLDALKGELPVCSSASLVVSWFGDDLRCGMCSLRPKVEQKEYDARNMPWTVAGLRRGTAQVVPQTGGGNPIYGGTPADAAVLEAIEALKNAGQEVMFYPFILMDQVAGNDLPDPYSGEEGQPSLPWRGRITLSLAPDLPGTPDGTAEADAQIAAFFGTASAADFSLNPPAPSAPTGPRESRENDNFDLLSLLPPTATDAVYYSGPDEWGYRRFILHYAALCAKAGGVESFCIGSEMRGLTQLRGADGRFAAVEALIDLAAEVRQILGPDVKISYAADWSEYFGYQPQDGSGDRYFHLDPLWADANIDFIGIDNYMPLSDWRDGQDHADASWGSIYALDYLKANVEGGEGYDWFYHSPEARDAQIRTPITDEAYGEPWVWRYKDIRNWWQNAHHDRVDGLRVEQPSPWIPTSKPIRFTEIGCAAIDKGTNEPNKFVDVKSSESALPRFSNGQRDDLIQRQYLRALRSYWTNPANNPVSEEYDAPMIDIDRAYVWAWDARPFPYFPNNRSLWEDGRNYARGHWITGRTAARSLASIVQEITKRAGARHVDTSQLYGYVSGYSIDQVSEARAALQPLMLRYGFDAIERDGVLRFRMRDGLADAQIGMDDLVRDGESATTLEETRAGSAEIAGRVRLRFVEADSDFDVVAEEAVLPDDVTHAVSTSEVPLAMTRAEGRAVTERWLSEARVSIDTVRLTLPPSMLSLGAGDVIGLSEAGGKGLFRIDRVEQMGNAQRIDGVRIEPESYRPIDIEETPPAVRPFVPPVPVLPLFLDLPLMTGQEDPVAPHLAVTAQPWPGPAALYASGSDSNYQLNRRIEARSSIGVLETALNSGYPGMIDRGDGVTVRMLSGRLESVDTDAILGGANLCAIGDGSVDGWELMQFRDAVLVGPDTYFLTYRLRGQLGTEALAATPWPAGSYLVMMNGIPGQIELADGLRRRAQHYRVGPAGRAVDDPSYQHAVIAFEGLGLRPYSPVHLRARTTAEGSTDISWIRRTRIDGDRWDTPEVPLGEESESYLIRVSQGGAILREQSTTEPSWCYEAAQKATDGVAGVYDIEVAQVSAKFGPGLFAKMAVTD